MGQKGIRIAIAVIVSSSGMMAVDTSAKVDKNKILQIIRGAAGGKYNNGKASAEEQVEIVIPRGEAVKKAGDNPPSPFRAKKSKDLVAIPVPNLKKGHIVKPKTKGIVEKMAEQGIFVNPLFFRKGTDTPKKEERKSKEADNRFDAYAAKSIQIPTETKVNILPNLPPENILIQSGNRDDYYKPEIIDDSAVIPDDQIPSENTIKTESPRDLLIQSL